MPATNLIRANIRGIVDTFDTHEAGIGDQGTYLCNCGWVGTEADWYTHLADALTELLTTTVVELPTAVA